VIEIGYSLSSEEHHPSDLVRYARAAEESGFTFAGISDHFHPWVDAQGHSPFVWGVLGAIAQATERLRVFTGVTCPTVRMHPAIVAHAAATAACLMPGRFSLGVGTGEALNEHILGDRWPPAPVRREMLEEAIEVIRLLWEGGEQSHDGRHYRVENARLYTRPDTPPDILVAAAGPRASELAGRVGDGLIATAPNPDTIEQFRKSGGESKPTYGQVTVCWAADEAEARRTALRVWPNTAVPGQLGQDLPTPRHFEQAVKRVREEDVAESVVCGPDPDKHVAAIKEFADLGFDGVYVHQVGPDQDGFFRFYREKVLPALAG
jgi:coenzyme F420-dependent glucose-6-phosphate dehydrogenase